MRAPDISMFFKLFYDQIRGKAIPPVEFQWVSKEGKIGWGEGRASLLKVDNVINEVLLITRDITERKELEENLKKYTIEMERLANERAEKLIESEKMVSAGAVASTVAHDLKGPLSVIRNAVYMMENNLGNNSDMIQMIKKSVDNAVNMLDETHEKVTTDILKVEEIEIKEFIESIVSETPIPPRIKLKVKLVESVLCIDILKIRRVLENLLRNAFEATLSKGTVQIENQIKKGKMVIIVKDSGEGIPTEKIKHLFKPFYTTKKKGTGLGLYYCKNTIEAHNGTIEVTSKQGLGTTFTLTIPLSVKEEMEYSTQNIIPEIMSPSFFPQ